MTNLRKSLYALSLMCLTSTLHATLISITPCTGANACTITNLPPNPIVANPNDGVLLAWDEVQNFTLAEALRVDRVFEDTASFVSDAGGGDFFLAPGTVVSSHYLQWDPGQGSNRRVEASVNLDSEIFAFITSDNNLFDSDSALGLPGLDYADFGLRGLESGDTTEFNGSSVNISFRAGSPGDWTRLITAFSPGGQDDGDTTLPPDTTPPTSVPEPSSLALLCLGMFGLVFRRRNFK